MGRAGTCVRRPSLSRWRTVVVSKVQFSGQGWHMCQKAFPVKMEDSGCE